VYSFTGGDDGTDPEAELILSGNTLYGTANDGGIWGDGSVFAVNTDGSGFTNVYSFTRGLDGAWPEAGLILSGNTLYGTTTGGGSGDNGTMFAVNTDGSGFTNLHNFTHGLDGAYPEAKLLLSGDTLYGTASGSCSLGHGTVFSIKTDGSGYTIVYSFTNGLDGAWPQAELILSGNTLYGTADLGGSDGVGTVFSLSMSAAQPVIVGVNLSGADLAINGSSGQSGRTYTTLASTNLLLPPIQWTPVATNILNADGNFTVTLTNAVDLSIPQCFYIFQVQ
jgi:uncharacterized repeat protein (TIGR03803 family)